MERRTDPRHPANAATVATTDFMRMPSRIENVSRGGCRLLTPARLRTSERIGLELPAPRNEIEFLTGCVVWSEAQCAGVVFDSPLANDLLGRLAQSSGQKDDLPCDVIRLDALRPSKR